MLDPETADERRDQIATETRQRIEGAAEIKAERSWGMRKLAYEIRQRNEADYRFFRFETESPLLDELDHTLKITDGVLRFRLFKVDPDSPVIEPPPPVSLASAATRGPRDRRPPRGPEPAAAADQDAAPTPAEPEPGPSEPGADAEAEAPADAEPAAQ